MNNLTYVVISDVSAVEFGKVLETPGALRWSVDGTQTLVKFEGETTPDFLEGKTARNHDEIRELMASAAWSEPDPE